MLYVDVPSEADLTALAEHRAEASVSIYLPTTPLSQQAAADRIEFGNLVKEALRQLREGGTDKRQIALQCVAGRTSRTARTAAMKKTMRARGRFTFKGRVGAAARWATAAPRPSPVRWRKPTGRSPGARQRA